MMEKEQSGKTLFRGELALVIAVLVNSFGVVLMLYSGAGISAISSVPYAFSLAFPALTLGTWTYLFQGTLIASLMIMRRKWVWPYLFSFVVGFVLACGVVVLRTMLDDTYKSADDIRKYTGMVVLASIPMADAGEQPKEKSELKRRTKRFADDIRRRVGGSSGRKA